MPTFLNRLRDLVLPAQHDDRRNIEALAAKLGVSRDDAAWIYRHSREVGYGAAMVEYDEICRQRPSDA